MDYLKYTQIADAESRGLRTDTFLASLFQDLNRTQIKKALETGNVSVNGDVIGRKAVINEGDSIEIRVPNSEKELIPHAVNIPLDVLFEDDDVIVVNKAPGMTVHPGSGTDADTLVHALLHHTDGKLSSLNGEDRPGIVHRLDKETSGVMIAAKTDTAMTGLKDSFQLRDVDKQYVALVSGVPKTLSGSIEATIGRHPTHRLKMAILEDGREAKTDWKVFASNNGVSLLGFKIYTGRTHQIRVHAQHLGHPILGDRLYGFNPNQIAKLGIVPGRPLLHSRTLALKHPITQKSMHWQASIPEDFNHWMKVAEIEHPI